MKSQILKSLLGRDCTKEYPGKKWYSQIFRKEIVLTNIQDCVKKNQGRDSTYRYLEKGKYSQVSRKEVVFKNN